MTAFEMSAKVVASSQWVEGAPCLSASSFVGSQRLRAVARVAHVLVSQELTLLVVLAQRSSGISAQNEKAPLDLTSMMNPQSLQC